jgi:hypothetical protein
VDAHRRAHQVAAQRAGRHLKDTAVVANGVAVGDLAILFAARDADPLRLPGAHEGRTGLLGGDGETGVASRQADIPDEAVGSRHVAAEAGQAQLRWRPVPQRAEDPPHAPACLGRMAGDVLDAQLGKRAADLVRLRLVDLTARFGRA